MGIITWILSYCVKSSVSSIIDEGVKEDTLIDKASDRIDIVMEKIGEYKIQKKKEEDKKIFDQMRDRRENMKKKYNLA